MYYDNQSKNSDASAVFILMTSLIISFMAYRSYKDSLALTATNGKALAISLPTM